MTKKINKNCNVAIIGMASIMPDAPDLQTYWNNLKYGKCSIRELPEERKKFLDSYLGLVHPERKDFLYKRGGYLENIEWFDYEFFGISYKEAKLMDPHQRLLLQVAYHSIEDAGINIDELSGTHTGVYVGVRSDKN